MSTDTFIRPCRRATRIVDDKKTCGSSIEWLGPWQRPPRSQDVWRGGGPEGQECVSVMCVFGVVMVVASRFCRGEPRRRVEA